MLKYSSSINEELFNLLDVDLLFVKGKRCDYLRLDIFNGVLYILKNGILWKELPSDFPPFKAVNYHYNKWKKSGVLDLILSSINFKVRKQLGLRGKPKLGVIYSSSVKNSNVSEIDGYDGNKCVSGIKRFAISDEIGLLISIKCTPANMAEVKGAELFVTNEFISTNWNIVEIIADNGIESNALKGMYKSKRINFKAMLRINRIKNKSDHQVARTVHTKRISIAQYLNNQISSKRYVIERSFAWMTNYRRLSKNYEKTTASAEAMVKLFGIRIALGKAIHF
jgi:putative transposase